MKHATRSSCYAATVLLASVLVLFALLIPGWAATGADDCNTRTPPADTGTPVIPTDTPMPTATWVTPTSPPEWTATPTVGVSPDPSPSATPGTDEPHRKATPTWDCNREYNPDKCLAPTGYPMWPIWAGIFLGMFAFIIDMIRRARDEIHAD